MCGLYICSSKAFLALFPDQLGYLKLDEIHFMYIDTKPT